MIRYFFTLIIIYLSASSAWPQNYFWVFLNTNPDRPELSAEKVDSIQNAHLNNIRRLATLKKLIVAGPFNGGGGIFVFRVPDENEVWNLLKTDPAIAANRFNLEVFPYEPLRGGICDVDNDVEMATHSFIRMKPSAVDDSASVSELIESISDDPKIIAAGELDNGKSAIILFDDSSFEETFKKAELVISGKIEYSIRELWVGKGSFCEKY